MDRFTCSGACADACWPSGWLAPAWRVEFGAESIFLHVLGLALMLAGLPVGWPSSRINRFSAKAACADARLALLLGTAGLLLGAAGLLVGWLLPGGWNPLLNGSFYMFCGLR